MGKYKAHEAGYMTLALPGTEVRAVYLAPDDFETAERLTAAYNALHGARLTLADYVGALVQAKAQREEQGE